MKFNDKGFKPCYKWNAFNTQVVDTGAWPGSRVLNLVISGMPSIRKKSQAYSEDIVF